MSGSADPDNGWMKSSGCHTSATCVEVRHGMSMVYVRNSQHKGVEEFLCFTHQEWEAFIAGVKNGDFDLPSPDPAG
jgi:hypothetical protein